MGYSLNQKGLFAGVVRNPSDRRQKLSDGALFQFVAPNPRFLLKVHDTLIGTNIASATEEEIFEKLGELFAA